MYGHSYYRRVYEIEEHIRACVCICIYKACCVELHTGLCCGTSDNVIIVHEANARLPTVVTVIMGNCPVANGCHNGEFHCR